MLYGVVQLCLDGKECVERGFAAVGEPVEHRRALRSHLQVKQLVDDAVKFALNRAELSPEAEARLNAFVEKLKTENRNVYVEIQGHTDATGDEAYNEELGEARAEAVRRALSRQGIALNRMATISYGEESPVAPNETPEGRAQNRRVSIVVLV